MWKNRIIGDGMEVAADLAANPRNWRIHPQHQQAAITGMLDQVGWVQRVIVNRATGYVVDGHARVALATTSGESVPVVYVDLTEEEEALVIAALDPIGAMAVRDEEIWSDLAVHLPDVVCVDLSAILPGGDSILEDVEMERSGAPGITGRLRIPPQSWLTMEQQIRVAIETVCKNYGITVEWPK